LWKTTILTICFNKGSSYNIFETLTTRMKLELKRNKFLKIQI